MALEALDLFLRTQEDELHGDLVVQTPLFQNARDVDHRRDARRIIVRARAARNGIHVGRDDEARTFSGGRDHDVLALLAVWQLELGDLRLVAQVRVLPLDIASRAAEGLRVGLTLADIGGYLDDHLADAHHVQVCLELDPGYGLNGRRGLGGLVVWLVIVAIVVARPLRRLGGGGRALIGRAATARDCYREHGRDEKCVQCECRLVHWDHSLLGASTPRAPRAVP